MPIRSRPLSKARIAKQLSISVEKLTALREQGHTNLENCPARHTAFSSMGLRSSGAPPCKKLKDSIRLGPIRPYSEIHENKAFYANFKGYGRRRGHEGDFVTATHSYSIKDRYASWWMPNRPRGRERSGDKNV